MVVDIIATFIGFWFLSRYLHEKRKLIPFVSILGFCWVAQYLGPLIDFWILVITGKNINATFAVQISYAITPVSIINSIWLGFSIFNQKWRRPVFYVYFASAVPFYIALFGWPNAMFVSNITPAGQMIDTSLRSVLLYLAIFYIVSIIFVIGLGFFSLRKRLTDAADRQRALYLGLSYVIFGIAAILETTTGMFGDLTLIIARVLMATYLVFVVLGFSNKNQKMAQSPTVPLETNELE
jgi:hypothetical protein